MKQYSGGGMMAVLRKIVFSISVLMICVVSACADTDTDREGVNGNHGGAVAPEYRWTTFAGLGEEGFRDGKGRRALFGRRIAGIAVNSEGNIFVADNGNRCIRKITPEGEVTLFSGKPGVRIREITDGPLDEATFWPPYGLAIDDHDNIFVTEPDIGVIRKISNDGIVSVYAGKPRELGHRDGPVSEALFHWPYGIAVDNDGNVYVTDRGNHTIRMISADGDVTTVAGVPGERGQVDGPGDQAKFYAPYGITVSPDGLIYVTEPRHRTIRKIDREGNVSTFTGFEKGQELPPDHRGIAIDGFGNFITASHGRQTITRISPDGELETIGGQYQGRLDTQIRFTRAGRDGVGTRARFYSPRNIAISNDGIIYITDRGENLIRKGEPVR